MQTQKIQITLTPEEVAALAIRGKTLGYNVTKYVKFIVSREAFETVESFPVFKMGTILEKKTLKALKEYEKGRSKKLLSIDEL
ncbi:hypothetical protein COV87_03000 [Candidatus Roizmanbacteria bacterium CG11_big_fil_rev_8_21_14_0_20_37_16]|uniref:Uncharacterized protein n=2 Tax=Candidatus Roizmaniibacteriota TaxID=1752723 RepID=A0A2H0KJT4_9BACT|nr:MAG: hypothetical protein COV87_03000 [Candidatus Roizmanbacteria bacterium CG11_big_fil_rev_8_21_14_0_20_37_16]PIU36616.1 MAG: hypothetical protein COT02_05150 [Candidatus Roizmanbacteria bacterium CG07_land_8_20_14_0_80_34_15]